MISIRIENKGDILQVRTLNEQAFDQPVEAGIVDKQRRCKSRSSSLTKKMVPDKSVTNNLLI